MIIDDEYLISAFHLTSGKVLVNSLFLSDGWSGSGDFNFYRIEEDKQMKLFIRTKKRDEDGEDYINEVMIGIISPDSIEYIEVDEIKKIKEEYLDILEVVEIETMEEKK